MNWLNRWLQRHKDALPEVQLPALDDRPLITTRFVVVDLETTGLDVRKDRLLAIGAVAIENGVICLGDQFEAVLQYPDLDPGDSVLVHEIGAQTLQSGQPPEDVLRNFLAWAGESVMVAFHVAFDQRVLQRSLKTHLNLKPGHAWLDTAEMLPAFFPDRAAGEGRLDDWVAAFDLSVSARHNASADAFVTAELTLAVLSQAQREGVTSLKALNDRLKTFRQLRQIHR
ncbi:3'-5' exonuclease [Marinobacteraceae bacterium S3BR75-40.1]